METFSRCRGGKAGCLAGRSEKLSGRRGGARGAPRHHDGDAGGIGSVSVPALIDPAGHTAGRRRGGSATRFRTNEASIDTCTRRSGRIMPLLLQAFYVGIANC